MTYIDFHTHIFPDKIAKPAIEALAKESGEYQPHTDGTLSALLASMDKAGIAASLVANIATRPAQSLAILEFSKEIKSDRIYPLISFHPSNIPDDVEDLFGEASREGIFGVKLHPMYQNFSIDARHMYGFYELMASFGFFVMFHTGFDIAFPGNANAEVEKIRKIANWFKDLTVVCTHVGGWRQWDRIQCLRGCDNVYTETSMTLPEMDDETFLRHLSLFSDDRILFGTDSPWTDQQEQLRRVLALNMPDARKEKLLYSNAAGLLRLKRS